MALSPGPGTQGAQGAGRERRERMNDLWLGRAMALEESTYTPWFPFAAARTSSAEPEPDSRKI